MTPSEELQADAERFKKAVNRYGTCTMVYRKEMSGDEIYPTMAFTCSACGVTLANADSDYLFCPYCGARIERFECLEVDSWE